MKASFVALLSSLRSYGRCSYGLWAAALLLLSRPLLATPSSQIWIPSTDAQAFAVVHLNNDVYWRPNAAPTSVVGPTVGVLPFQKVQAELGFDMILSGLERADRHPFYLHGKIALPENALTSGAPAVAVGVYNAGTTTGLTNQNISYALAARTLADLGRFSLGYFVGNPQLFRQQHADGHWSAAHRGFLASWDRTMHEISDQLWLGIDYQGSHSSLGAVSGGVAWYFKKNLSLLVGYDHYLNHTMAGSDTVTVQLDINVI